MPVKLAPRNRSESRNDRRAFRLACTIACAVGLLAVILAPATRAQTVYPLPLPKPDLPVGLLSGTPPLPLDKPPPPTVDEVAETVAPEPEPPAEQASSASEDEPAETETAALSDGEDSDYPPLPMEKPELAPLQQDDADTEAQSQAPTDSDNGWTTAEIDAEAESCRRLLANLVIDYEPAGTIGNPEGCGIASAILVRRIGGAHPVEIAPPATLNCKLTAALHQWVVKHVQPNATELLDGPVARIQNVSSYVCRRRDNSPKGKLSEHALGNALDIASFTTTEGTVVSVKDDWPGGIEALLSRGSGRFLEQVHSGACKVFSTTLGPEADAAHADHFHFDLGRGGRYLICE